MESLHEDRSQFLVDVSNSIVVSEDGNLHTISKIIQNGEGLIGGKYINKIMITRLPKDKIVDKKPDSKLDFSMVRGGSVLFLLAILEINREHKQFKVVSSTDEYVYDFGMILDTIYKSMGKQYTSKFVVRHLNIINARGIPYTRPDGKVRKGVCMTSDDITSIKSYMENRREEYSTRKQRNFVHVPGGEGVTEFGDGKASVSDYARFLGISYQSAYSMFKPKPHKHIFTGNFHRLLYDTNLIGLNLA